MLAIVKSYLGKERERYVYKTYDSWKSYRKPFYVKAYTLLKLVPLICS